MSISDILVGVNSSALNVPLNHTNWLLDYKINGTKSYVYKDKDILHELYRSPISANDEDIQTEAVNYIAAEESSYLGLWFSKNYGFRDLMSLRNCVSILDFIGYTDAINRMKTSEFRDTFFAINSVISAYANTDGLKIASYDNDVMSILESNDTFLNLVASNADAQTITTSTGTLIVENAYILSINVGAYRKEGLKTNPITGLQDYYYTYYRGSADYVSHGSNNNTNIVSSLNNVENGNAVALTVNKFVKSMTITQPPTYNATNTIKYIQLDKVV